MGCVHRLDHVHCEPPNAIVDLLDPFALCPQDWVAVLQDWQDHFSSRVKAGKFLTPPTFNASMIFMIVPKEAFLSACSASVDLRASGKLIWTSGWSFLNVVETTKKISRMIRISTSETIIMRGARRFRTAKFMD